MEEGTESPTRVQAWSSEPIKVLEICNDSLFAGAGSNVMIWASLKMQQGSVRPFVVRICPEEWPITSISCSPSPRVSGAARHTHGEIEVLVTSLYSYRKFVYSPTNNAVTRFHHEVEAMQGEMLAGHCFDGGRDFLVYDVNNHATLHEAVDEMKWRITTFKGTLGAPDSVRITGVKVSEVLIFVSNFATVFVCTLKSFGASNLLHSVRKFSQDKGVIFSINFYPESKLIVTTSDDRSVVAWKCTFDSSVEGDSKVSANYSIITRPENFTLEKEIVLEGHTARVFNAMLVNDHIISVGEDSNVVAWPLKDVRSHHVIGNHSGSTIWSCAYQASSGFIYSCGDDGSIFRWQLAHVLQKQEMKECELYRAWDPPDFPRLVKSFDLASSLVTTNSGRVVIVDEKEVIYSHEDPSWRKYLTITLSPDKSLYAVGNIAGSISFNFLSEKSPPLLVQLPKMEKIMSAHFLSQSELLVSTLTTLLHYYLSFEENSLLEVICNWSVKQKSNVNCVETVGNVIFVGMDNGKIKVYHKVNGKKLCELNTRHSRIGVGGIIEYQGQLVSGGRDSKLNFFYIDDQFGEEGNTVDAVTHLKSVPLPFLWVGSFVKYKGDLLVCGFESVDFAIYSLKRERIIARANCGGAHRAWDFLISENGAAAFKHIRSRKLYKTLFQLDQHVTGCVKEGFHLDNVNAVIEIPTATSDSSFLLATASDDCSVKISCFCLDADCYTEAFAKSSTETICSHTSAVRCLHYQESKSYSEGYLISGGGRSEVLITKLHLKVSRLIKYENVQRFSFLGEVDFRVMEIKSALTRSSGSETSLVIFAACSDGFLRILQENDNSKLNNFQGIYRKISGTGHCLTTIQLLENANSSNVQVIAGTSAGSVVMWTVNLDLLISDKIAAPNRVIPLNVMSVTSLCISDRRMLLVGGDDGSLTEISIRTETDTIRRNLTNDGILGVQTHGESNGSSLYFLSGGKLYKSGINLERIACLVVPIEDGKGITICKSVLFKGRILSPFVTFGKGMSVFTIPIN